MLKIKKAEDFSNEVEELVKKYHLTYMEAIVKNLHDNNIDVDSARVKRLLSPNLQKKLKKEAISYNMIRKKKKKM